MRGVRITDTDLALLRAIGKERSVVAASRSIGMTRDRANYRILRLTRALGGPVVGSERGGSRHGGSRLTELGRRLARGGFTALERPAVGIGERGVPPNRFRGVYRSGPNPAVDLEHGLSLRVAFQAPDRSAVGLLVDPEAILLAKRRFPSSARNVLPGVVEGRSRRARRGPLTLRVRAGGQRWRVALTEEPLRELELARGARVWLYVKATAVRRGP